MLKISKKTYNKPFTQLLICAAWGLFLPVMLLFAQSAKAQDVYLDLMDKKANKETTYKTLKTKDWVYEPYIRTVEFYTQNQLGGLTTKLIAPIISLNSQRSQKIILEFDELGDEPDYYEAKVIHCNSDWSVSNELEINYLEEYNEFNLNDFEMASNTRVNYSHYTFEVPRVKISGNYLLKVYREGEEDDLILTRRLVIYEPQTIVGIRQVSVLGSMDNLQRQQLDIAINYSGLKMINGSPRDDVKIVLRQNNRWDNAIVDLKPRFINQLKTTLDYDMTDLSNTFWAGNEFRHFDFGTFQRVGFNIDKVVRQDTINGVYPFKDKPRNTRAYDAQAIDLDGHFIIANRDFPAATQADYSEVHFRLETGNPLGNKIYLTGKFADWQLKAENQMVYNAETGTYQLIAVMKQGAYDYQYVALGATENSLEGNHARTQNDYDVIVYFRPFGARGDRAVGYGRLDR